MKSPTRYSRRPPWLLLLIAVAVLVGIGVSSRPHSNSAAPAGAAIPAAAAGDRFQATGDLILKPGDVVEHDAIALDGKIVVPAGAHVKNDVVAANGAIEIGGIVDNDVRALNGDVTLDAGANVHHDVIVANGAVQQARGAQVGGKVSPAQTAGQQRSDDSNGGLLGLIARLLGSIVLAAVLVGVGTLLILAWPRQIGRAVSALESTPLPAIAVGLFTAVLLPPVVVVLSMILVITIIGILVVWVPGLALLLGWFYGIIVLGLWAGRRLADSGHVPLAQGSLLVTAALGLTTVIGLPLLLGAVVPWLGWTLAYLAGFVGLGAAVLTRLGGAAGLSRLTGQIGPRATHPLTPPDRKAS